MSKFARILGFFSFGLAISLIITYWLKQEEARSRTRLAPVNLSPAPPKPVEPPIVLSHKALDAAEESSDDLTRIIGIGPKIAEALHAIEVHNFADLATASADELLPKLQGVRGISIEKIKRWIDQAKEFTRSKRPHA